MAQSIDHETLVRKLLGSNFALGTWWWGRISPNQPYAKDATAELTTNQIVECHDKKYERGIPPYFLSISQVKYLESDPEYQVRIGLSRTRFTWKANGKERRKVYAKA